MPVLLVCIIHFHDRVIHLLEELVLEVGATERRDLRWRSAVFDEELLEIEIGCSMVGLHGCTPPLCC
jgi:hypothetical protein